MSPAETASHQCREEDPRCSRPAPRMLRTLSHPCQPRPIHSNCSSLRRRPAYAWMTSASARSPVPPAAGATIGSPRLDRPAADPASGAPSPARNCAAARPGAGGANAGGAGGTWAFVSCKQTNIISIYLIYTQTCKYMQKYAEICNLCHNICTLYALWGSVSCKICNIYMQHMLKYAIYMQIYANIWTVYAIMSYLDLEHKKCHTCKRLHI